MIQSILQIIADWFKDKKEMLEYYKKPEKVFVCFQNFPKLRLLSSSWYPSNAGIVQLYSGVNETNKVLLFIQRFTLNLVPKNKSSERKCASLYTLYNYNEQTES